MGFLLRCLGALGVVGFIGGCAASASIPVTKLMMIGGGNHPPAAIAQFRGWAGSGTVLVVCWATGYPNEAYASLQATSFVGMRTAVSPMPPASDEDRKRFLSQLADAKALYFCGGDQNRVMDALAQGPEVLAELKRRFAEGTPFAGSSAGTAIMSSPMIGDDGPLLREGLGLVGGIIVDQHFFVRKRRPRLAEAVRRTPGVYGLGIEEDAAVTVLGGRVVEVFGGPVLVLGTPVDESGDERLESGQRYDLADRQRL